MPGIDYIIETTPFKLRSQTPLQATNGFSTGPELVVVGGKEVVDGNTSTYEASTETGIDVNAYNPQAYQQPVGRVSSGDDFLNKVEESKDAPRNPNENLEARINDPNTNPKRRAKMEITLKNRKERQAKRLVNQTAKAKEIYQKHGIKDWDTRQKEQAETDKKIKEGTENVERIAKEGINVKPYSYGD